MTPVRKDPSRGARAAVVGAALGLAPAAALGFLRFFLSEGPPGSQIVGTLSLALVYASPYLVVLMASRVRSPGARGGLLAPIGLLSLVASFSTMSLVTVALLPATLFIWLASARSIASAARPLATILPAAIGGTIVAAAIVTGFLALLVLQEDETGCWVLSSDHDGRLRWEAHPNVGAPGTLSLGPIEGPSIRSYCTSDVITPTEAAMSIGILAAALLGTMLLSRLPWPDSPPKQSIPGGAPAP